MMNFGSIIWRIPAKRAREIAQLGLCLLGMHEDLNWIKLTMAVGASNPSSGEAETGRSLELIDQACLPNW